MAVFERCRLTVAPRKKASLEQAVESKIEEQLKFATWHDVVVGENHSGDRKSSTASVVLDSKMRNEDVLALTGMKQQRISDLKKSLDKLDLYRHGPLVWPGLCHAKSAPRPARRRS